MFLCFLKPIQPLQFFLPRIMDRLENRMMYFVAERYCVFCRNELPYFTYMSSTLRHCQPYELNVLGFIDVSDHSSCIPDVFTFKTRLDDPGYVYNSSFALRNKQWYRKFAAIVYDVPNTISRPAFFAHVTCMRVARMIREEISYRDVYNLAIQLIEVFPRDCWASGKPWHLASLSYPIAIRKSSLGFLLAECSRLPTELQGQILRHLRKSSFIFSLLATLRTSSLTTVYCSSVISDCYQPTAIVSEDHVDAAHLCASFATIMGHEYLYSVEVCYTTVSHDALKHRQCIEVSLNLVRKLEFIVGLYGVSAIRFHLGDGSTSAWLGNTKHGWRFRPVDITRNDLFLLKNGHKGVLRHVAEFSLRGAEGQPEGALWGKYWDPSRAGEYHVAHMYHLDTTRRLKCFPGRLICNYLPLRLNGQHARAITVYTSFYGTSSITVHGRDADYEASTSRRRGTPTCFYFSEGERIVALGMVTIGYYNGQFGPYLMSTRWLSLIPAKMENGCDVLGIIVDRVAVVNDTLKAFGVHCKARGRLAGEDEELSAATEPPISLPSPPETLNSFPFNSGSNMSTARMVDIKQLRVQKREVRDQYGEPVMRCCGLWILHGDGTIEILGLWDGSRTAESITFYNAEADGRIHNMVFHLTRGGNWKDRLSIAYHVSNIIAQVVVGEEDMGEVHAVPPNEVASPPDKVFSWEISWAEPLLTWCFTEWIDHLEACSSAVTFYNLKEHEKYKLKEVR
ncbi:hypothetical protein TARUN_7891 [Trichoderma arundinaceum]|uniref:Uncharacterized protein n=1 Tax=Trichoderma arundinaceum TaxID=490622 RepID=A0A395NE15_TRIAR|nr:hypothetical protein TARUN_7891 [Trichoderma arundinaceum]